MGSDGTGRARRHAAAVPAGRGSAGAGPAGRSGRPASPGPGAGGAGGRRVTDLAAWDRDGGRLHPGPGAGVRVAAGRYPVEGDAEALRRMLVNLIDNAVRYARSEVTVDGRASDGWVLVTVTTMARASPRATRSGRSSGSPHWTERGPGATAMSAAPGWAWPSSARRCRRTTGPRGWRMRARAASRGPAAARPDRWSLGGSGGSDSTETEPGPL